MKRFAMLFFFIFVSLSANGFAQKYYSLPEIKEQAKEGWHETYTDKYGREMVEKGHIFIAPMELKLIWINHTARIMEMI